MSHASPNTDRMFCEIDATGYVTIHRHAHDQRSNYIYETWGEQYQDVQTAMAILERMGYDVRPYPAPMPDGSIAQAFKLFEGNA